MKYNGQNIIADSDIVMTGQQTGHNLSEIINQHENDISNLKSNVKWIYKYGGVGSGSGGGGGSASSAPWNFRVELGEVAREDGTTVNLGKQGEYKLAISLFKVQGRSFTVKYTYDTPQGVKITEKEIPPTKKSVIEDVINLQVNGTLSVSINDDEGNYDQFIIDYIVTAYSFAIDYVYADDKSVFNAVDNNIFVGDVSARGLLARFTSIVSVDVKSYYIEYYDWNQTKYTYEIDNIDEKYIYFDLGIPLSNDKSGNYQFKIIPHLVLSGKNEEEQINPFVLSDNLIPDTIYLKVQTDGTLYDKTDVHNPYEFYAGTISFYVTGFQGYPDASQTYSLKVYINDILYEGDGVYGQLKDQQRYELKIPIGEVGQQSITFWLNRKGVTYQRTYYFYTKDPLGSFVWFPLNCESKKITPIKSYQYRYSYGIDSVLAEEGKVKAFPGTNKNTMISMTKYSNKNTYNAENLSSIDYQAEDCMLSIGINYSKLNDLQQHILYIYGNKTESAIQIYQNKAIILGKQFPSFYLPMDDQFHLITIYRRKVSYRNGAPVFEISIYMDGILESALSGFIQDQDSYYKIELNKGLYQINHLEIAYFEHQEVTSKDVNKPLTVFEKYNPNPNIYPITYMTDSGILYYYYSYKLAHYPDSIPENFKTAYSYISQFYANPKTGRIEVNYNMIAAIASEVDVPVLLVNYVEPRTSTDSWSSTGSEFMSWLEKSYDITKDTGITNKGYKVNIAYSKGKQDLQNIDIASKFKDAYFQIFLQGTSTLNYGSKNFDLAVDSPEEDYTYLYSPNFNEQDNTTFLPEKRFTLKADVVDSSHSNNNAIGKFINTVTTKFHDAKQENNQYNKYLKNTLEGFPVLVFLQNSYMENHTTQTLTDDYYFLGIYNFNLGRDSEFNLGFKDLRFLPDQIENGFAVTRINNDLKIGDMTLSAKSYVENLGVMEIRENRNYFDFSQYDKSVLFSVSDEDNDYMFSKFKSNKQEILETEIQTLVEGVCKSGGYIFDSLGKNMSNTKEEGEVHGYGYDLGYKTELKDAKNMVPNYKYQFKRTFEQSRSVLTPKDQDPIKGERSDLIRVLLGDDTLEDSSPLLDYTSLTEYYVICMALGLLDSVLKNMNFRKWDKKFYLAFYDMDTSLGKDNAGRDSDYLCFSDYWRPAYTGGSGSFRVLQPAVSYKDWYDKSVSGGYDVPSSYLFAIAKYAYHVYQDSQLADWYPQNLWARFRRKDTIIPQWDIPQNGNVNHIGCLQNADTFIDNYYAGHLHNVPDTIFNFNYRAKYMRIDQETSNGYNGDFERFSGRRIHYVRDWLNSRFHLLDLYFNISAVADSVSIYDMDEKCWKIVPNTAYKPTDMTFVDITNPDIEVLYDAFVTNNASAKYSQDINVKFTALDYSPLSLSGAHTVQYLTDENKNDAEQYIFAIDSNGKALKLGGSGSWLTLDSINTLLQNVGFYVKSNNLTTISGTEGSCQEWHLDLPSLVSIELTSPGYTGTLELPGKDRCPNLSSIDISESKLSLLLQGSNVSTIDASGVGPADVFQIIDCPNITSLNLQGSIFQTINITSKNSVDYFSTYKYKQKDDGSWEQTSVEANSPKCHTLTIANKTENGILFISDQTYTVSGTVDGLTTLTVSGYKEIYIENCPQLNRINISDPHLLRKLHVKSCSSDASDLSIGATASNTIDLRNCTNLQEVSFYNTKKFQNVYLPDNTQLLDSAFALTSISKLSGDNLRLGKKVFDSSRFTLKQVDNDELCSFDISIQDFSNMFIHCAVTLDTFNKFNNKYANELGQVTITDYMWWNNPLVKYDETSLLEDYQAGTSRFNLSMYKNVTSAQHMMGGTNVSACHKDTLKDFGSSSGVNLTNFYGWSEQAGKTVTIPLNWLEEVKNKVTKCSTSKDSVIYKVVEFKNNAITQVLEFNPITLFQGSASNKITELSNWVFDSNHTLNFQNTFLNFPKLTTLTKCFVGCKGKNLQYTQDGETKGFLFKNKTLKSISGCFGFTNYASITVNLGRYLDWENLPSSYKGFVYVSTWDETYNVLKFNKTLSSVSQLNLIYTKLLSKYSGTSLSHVFRNCIITDDSTTPVSFVSTTPNTTITSIDYLFSNLQLKDSQNNELPIQWDWNIVTTIPKVTQFYHSFEKIKFKGSLPFDFFKRRKETRSSVYIKNDNGEFEQATLYQYTYTTDISNLRYCFADCEFEIPTYIPTQEDLNKMSRLQQENTVLQNKIWYASASDFSATTTIKNTEFDDLGKTVANAALLSSTYEIVRNPTSSQFVSYSNWEVTNVNNDTGQVDYCILPPDFFYACTNTARLEGCFSNTNLQGYIPDNLLINCKQATITNFLQNTLVFPKFYDTKYNSSLTEKLNIYYYIGSNFCLTTTLDNAFNFKIQLPGDTIQHDDYKESQLHVFCFKDSFSKDLVSMQNAIPVNIRQPIDGIFSVQHLDHSVYLNTMYDKTTEREQEDGEKIYQVLGNLGFDLTYYNKLKADYLINEVFSQFMYNNAFDRNTTLQSIKRSKSSNWAIKWGGYNSTLGVSKNGVWPSAAVSVSKLINYGSTRYIYKDGVFTNTSGPLKIHTNNISGYNPNMKNYYINSKYVDNAWSLEFI